MEYQIVAESGFPRCDKADFCGRFSTVLHSFAGKQSNIQLMMNQMEPNQIIIITKNYITVLSCAVVMNIVEQSSTVLSSKSGIRLCGLGDSSHLNNNFVWATELANAKYKRDI